MTAASPARRPFLLSLVTILMIISGVLRVLAGLATVALNSNSDFQDQSGESRGTLLVLGVIGILFGLANIWLALLLRSGSRFARAVVLVFETCRSPGRCGRSSPCMRRIGSMPRSRS
jgi:hypothetical protein